MHLHEEGIAANAVHSARAAKRAIDLVRRVDPGHASGFYVKAHVVVLELQVALHAVALHFRHEAERAFPAVLEELAAASDEPLRAGLAHRDVDGGDLRIGGAVVRPVGEGVFAVEVRRGRVGERAVRVELERGGVSRARDQF